MSNKIAKKVNIIPFTKADFNKNIKSLDPSINSGRTGENKYFWANVIYVVLYFLPANGITQVSVRKKYSLLTLCALTLLLTPKIYTQGYIEGYVGGMFGRANITKLSVKNIYNQTDLKAYLFCLPSEPTAPSATGGLKLGLWGENN